LEIESMSLLLQGNNMQNCPNLKLTTDVSIRIRSRTDVQRSKDLIEYDGKTLCHTKMQIYNI